MYLHFFSVLVCTGKIGRKKIQKMARRHLFRKAGYSDFDDTDYVTPLVVCSVIFLVAMVVYCMCRDGSRSGCKACATTEAVPPHAEGAARGSVVAGPVTATSSRHLEDLISSECVVVFFHAQWCHHCKTAKPEFEAAAAAYVECRWVLADEARVEARTLEAHGIRGFPTIALYRRGTRVATYSGDRTAQDMAQWARSA